MSVTTLIPEATLERLEDYLEDLQGGRVDPGKHLQAQIAGRDLAGVAPWQLLAMLLDTKPPQIFAESAVVGDGSDWTLRELRLLGDISIAVDVTIFDDGRHSAPAIHATPLDGTLVFTPGALLRHGMGGEPADLEEVTRANGSLCPTGYEALYHRRLLPVLRHIHADAQWRGTRALVTVPGLGCGQFAGRFHGQLGAMLESVLECLLESHGADLPAIRAVYYDPYNECSNRRRDIHGISWMVRPLTQGNDGKPQLCTPQAYAEGGDDFSGCRLYSLVAWDHVSWPGNDFFGGSRCTDDGVKAAATDSMFRLTGIEGRYKPGRHAYQPPSPHRTWGDVVAAKGLRLSERCGL